MKTMGKVGLYRRSIGGEFFEPLLDTNSGKLAEFFPNMHSPVGGVGFETVIKSALTGTATRWVSAKRAISRCWGCSRSAPTAPPFLWSGGGARFEDLIAEPIRLASKGKADRAIDLDISDEDMSLNTVSRLFDAFGVDDRAYVDTSFTCAAPKRSTALR